MVPLTFGGVASPTNDVRNVMTFFPKNLKKRKKKTPEQTLSSAGSERASEESNTLHLKRSLPPVKGSQCPSVRTTENVGALFIFI